MYYYNARYYNPLLGRFISKDPITHRNDGVLGFNEYIYVKNNPLKYVDPDGKTTKEIQKILKEQEQQFMQQSGQSTNSTLQMCTYNCTDVNPFALLDYSPILTGDFSDVYALYTGKTLFGQKQLTSEQQDMIGAYAMLPILTAGQGRLLGEVAEAGDKAIAKGANVAGHVLEGVPQAALDRLMARLKGLKIGGKPVIDMIEAFGSRTAGRERGRGPFPTSDLDMLLHVYPDIRQSKNWDWTRKVIDEIATDFKKMTNFDLAWKSPPNLTQFKDDLIMHYGTKFFEIFKR